MSNRPANAAYETRCVESPDGSDNADPSEFDAEAWDEPPLDPSSLDDLAKDPLGDFGLDDEIAQPEDGDFWLDDCLRDDFEG